MKLPPAQQMRGTEFVALTVFSLICALGFLGALTLALIAAPRLPAQVPSGKDVVAPTAYVSLDPAGRGSTAQIAVVMKIRPGFHVNARRRQPHQRRLRSRQTRVVQHSVSPEAPNRRRASGSCR